MSESPLLTVKDLKTSLFTDQGEIKAVDGISYHVDAGEVVALVGESGCGKSISQLSLLQLIPAPPGKILGGKVLFGGDDLLRHGPRSAAMQAVRGAGIAMIFQEPMTSLNPVLTVGRQLSEVIRVHAKVGKPAAWQRAIEALAAVGIAAARMDSYPFEMSGGMRQRVMIATAVACNARLIIADEPTTALDVTTQAQVMALLCDLVDTRNTGLVIITHNLGLVARYAQRVYVMYAGKIVESGSTRDVLTSPRHPYTIGLLRATPRLDGDVGADLQAIEGAPPRLQDLPPHCAFAPRCRFAVDDCRHRPFPPLRAVGAAHQAACHRDIAEHRDV